MKSKLVAVVLGLAGFVGAAAPGWAKEPLVDQVRAAIDRGVLFLRDQAKNTGDWEIDPASAGRRGGHSCLALLALLNAGVKPDDPVIENGLKFLRTVPPKDTYVVGLQTMVYAAAGRPEDAERIQRNVNWLIDAAVRQNGLIHGWTYGKSRFVGGADNSNTQYALLGLHDGHQAGATIDQKVWKEIRKYYIDTQNTDGSWAYNPIPGTHVNVRTMTPGGLCGLLIAGMELNEGREQMIGGQANRCGDYVEADRAALALEWIGRNFRLEAPHAIFYNLYGLERTGRLTGRRFLGDHDWYREGCEYLVANQRENGSWRGTNHDSYTIVSTSFALLFLSKGRTPILISKLTHGPREDWNNDRNDARNLINYASKELFKKLPMAWQIFESQRAFVNNDRAELLGIVGELMQSPIAYFNGHEAPVFSDGEKELLKEYVEQGGFILAEACCGRKAFDQGFRQLMRELFPENPLRELGPEHPIWRAHALVKPDAFPLWGIEHGCKTVVVYSPQDLSCWWESNRLNDARGQQAFRLGGNIIAYATGLEPPKPRLTEVKISNEKMEEKIPRGYLKVVQLKHDGDWQPAPRAMRRLMAHMRDGARLDVALKTETLDPHSSDVLNFKFLYMHGRKPFNYDNDALDNLRSDLQTGGLLFADACCGKKEFDASFRAFVAKLFADKKLERIPPTDELFGKDLNGEAITTVRCRRERADGIGPEAEFRDVQPYLEGIKLNNRWVVIYSRYDIGCALENHQSTDCLGHDLSSALKLGSAAVLYAIKR